MSSPTNSLPAKSRFLAFFDECGNRPLLLLAKPNRPPQFITELSGIMERLPFTLFISAIRKQAHLELRGLTAANPYDLALEFTMEGLFHFLKEQGEQDLPIMAEARGRQEDNLLEQVFSRMMTQGTAKVPAEQFHQMDCSLSFHSKKTIFWGCSLPICAPIRVPGIFLIREKSIGRLKSRESAFIIRVTSAVGRCSHKRNGHLRLSPGNAHRPRILSPS